MSLQTIASPEVGVAHQARDKRWNMLLQHFPDLAEMRVLDLGGNVRSWQQAPVRPRQLWTLNLDVVVRNEEPVDWAHRVTGDACDPPSELANERFDLVYSNSVLEHVGGHIRRVAFSDAVHALGDAHWVQTPYRYFPVEPHAVCPGLQFLPMPIRARLLRRWPIGNMRGAYSAYPGPHVGWYPGLDGTPLRHLPLEQAARAASSVELLSVVEMQMLFPQSEIVKERFVRLPKSLIAVRR